MFVLFTLIFWFTIKQFIIDSPKNATTWIYTKQKRGSLLNGKNRTNKNFLFQTEKIMQPESEKKTDSYYVQLYTVHDTLIHQKNNFLIKNLHQYYKHLRTRKTKGKWNFVNKKDFTITKKFLWETPKHISSSFLF